MTREVRLVPVLPFPLVAPGDDLFAVIRDAVDAAGLTIEQGDVLVLAQKIVSKAEGRYRRLSSVVVSDQAKALAAEADKHPGQVQLILDESREVLRVRPGVIIVEHRNGYVHANAGIDRSNIPNEDGDPQVLLLPEDSDASARTLRQAIKDHYGVEMALIINDSAGRAWRNGTMGFALGCSGIEPVSDLVGKADLYSRPLEVTEVAVADELAAAASFIMGQASEGCPLVIVRGADYRSAETGSASLLRDRKMDMFR